MKSPFKFLDSYTKDDREIFFGREREIEELYHRVFESKIMLVYGVSGTGKSSLIHCGLANKFSETDWLPLMIRRGGNIIESMAAAIKSSSLTEQLSKFQTPADFKKGVRSLYLDHYKPVFFIFDQFEELFIFGDREERKTFIQIVKILTESDLQCRFIFVIREEYMASFTEFERVVPAIFQNRVRIEKMSHRNAIEAIKGPCRVFNIELEEGFAETLLEKLCPGETDVELTYLQVFLDKVYRFSTNDYFIEGRQGEVSFKLSLLSRTGNVADLLGSFLEEQVSLLVNPDAALVLLKSFVSVKGTKQPMKAEEAMDYSLTLGREIRESDIREMILTFVNLRILCDKDQNERYELRHDALAAKIFEKFTMAEKELLEVRKFVENSFDIYSKRGTLLSKQDIDYLSTYENKLILPDKLKVFIDSSRKKYETQQRALRRITTISTIILLVLLAFVLRFYSRKQNETNINDQFSAALLAATEDPIKGLISELAIWEQDTSSIQLHEIILRDFQRLADIPPDTSKSLILLQQYLKPIVLESNILNAFLSQKEKFIYGWLEDNTVFVHELSSEGTKYIKNDVNIKHIEFSEEKSMMALVHDNNKVTVYTVDGKKQFEFAVTLNGVNYKNTVRFMRTEKGLIASANGNIVTIFDKEGRLIYELNRHSGPVNSVDISPDGNLIVTSASDNKGFVWNYNSQIQKFNVYDSLIGHNGIIWSCRFNKTGKYIITASEDSTIKIWDLYGNHVNPEFKFMIWSTRYRLNNREEDEDRTNPDFSKYYGKFCDAVFSPSELEIIATGYISDNASADKNQFYKVMFFDGSGGYPHAYKRNFFLNEEINVSRKPQDIIEFLISPDEKVAAVIQEKSDQISLTTGWGSQLQSFTGRNPAFSSGGKEIYWTSSNRIHKWPVHPKEIKRILEKFRITSSDLKKEKVLLEL